MMIRIVLNGCVLAVIVNITSARKIFGGSMIDHDAIDAAVDEQLQGRQTEDDPAPGRPGRPKGSKNAPKPPEMQAAQPVVIPSPPEGEHTKDALVVWPHIIENILKPKGVGPSAVMFSAERIGIGPFPSDSIPVGRFDGEAVAGEATVSPGDAIVNYVTEVFHLGRRNQGPAVYKLRCYWKSKGDTIRIMDVKLDDPAEITAQRAREIRYAQSQMGSVPSRMPAYQAPPYAPGAPYQPPPPGPQGQSPQEMFSMFQSMMGMVTDFNERARAAAAAAGQQAPPQFVVQQAPPQPPPAPVEPPKPRLTEEEQQFIDEGKFRKMASSMGFVPRDSIPQAPAPSSQQVAAAVQNPVDGLRSFLTTIKELDKIRGDVNKALGVGEPPDDPDPEPDKAPFSVVKIPLANFKGKEILWPRNVEGGFLEWAQAAVMSNLEVSTDLGMGALKKLSEIVDQTSFGKLLAQLAEKGGAAANVARLGQGLQATGPALPPNGVPRRGPSA
jgi:hypothetical protein